MMRMSTLPLSRSCVRYAQHDYLAVANKVIPRLVQRFVDIGRATAVRSSL